MHFFARDAHNLTSRPLRLQATYDQVAKLHGEDVARALLEENPRAAFEGRPLPFIPELDESVGLAPGATAPTRKKRFWFF